MTRLTRQAAQRHAETPLGSAHEQSFDTYVLQFAPAVAGLYVSEYVFLRHGRRRWRFDKAVPAYSVAVELHGAEFTNGRHTRGTGFIEDRKKMNAAQLAGWLVLEFTGTMLRNDPEGCIHQFVQALHLRGWSE